MVGKLASETVAQVKIQINEVNWVAFFFFIATVRKNKAQPLSIFPYSLQMSREIPLLDNKEMAMIFSESRAGMKGDKLGL